MSRIAEVAKDMTVHCGWRCLKRTGKGAKASFVKITDWAKFE
jgi:hypothetical protein